MAEETIITTLVNLSGTGIMVYILWRLLDKVLDRQATESQQLFEALFGLVKENTAAMATNAAATATNTDVMGKVERAVIDLPDFVERVIERLSRGESESANHEQRLEVLEDK